MPYSEVPAFTVALRARHGVASRALEFLILTSARVSEVTGAKLGEIEEAARVWVVPANRMKAERVHRVPLCDRALEILAEMKEKRRGSFVFPSIRADRPLSNAAFEAVLNRMKVTGATPHGFRSSFRDWAGDCTNHSRETIEAALAHTVGDETERAYRRGDALEKRRTLMDEWSSYLSPDVKSDAPDTASRPTE